MSINISILVRDRIAFLKDLSEKGFKLVLIESENIKTRKKSYTEIVLTEEDLSLYPYLYDSIKGDL